MSAKHGFAVGLAVLIGLALVASPAYAKKDKGATATATVDQTVTLPEAAAKAVKDAFPDATTGAVKMENDGGMLLYAVELSDGSVQKVVTVAYDGMIAGVKTPIDDKDVPEAAAKAIRSADAAATVSKFMKVEVRAEVKQDGGTPKLVKCEKPGTAYEGVLAKGDLTGRIKVAEDGTVITSVAWDTPTSAPAPAAKVKGGKKKNK